MTKQLQNLESCLKNSDIVFVAINHSEFKFSKKAMDYFKPGMVVIDIWNCFQEKNIAYII